MNEKEIAKIGTRILETEDKFFLSEKVPEKIAEKISLVSLKVTNVGWMADIEIDLSTERPSPECIGSYDQEGDCILYLPDSTGVGTIRLNDPNGHPYPIGTVYYRIRQPFSTIYLENTAQAQKKLFLKVGRGDFDVSKPVVSPSKTPYIYKVELTHPGVRYSQALPIFTRRLKIQTTDQSPFRVAFSALALDGNWEEAPEGIWENDKLFLIDTTLYLVSYKPGKIALVFAWV